MSYEAETQQVEEDYNDESALLWGRLIPLDGGSPIELQDGTSEVMLGRQGQSDVVVVGVGISGKHCRIYRVRDEGQCVMVEDLSRYGTFIGGKLVGKNKRTILSHGAELTLGQSGKGFIFHVVKDASESQNSNEVQSPFEAKYDLQEIVGRGNFSVVRLAVNKETGRKCAVKIVDKSKFTFNTKVLSALEREVEILRSVQPHVNVVGFEDFFEEGGTLYIVMELLPGGDLQKLVQTRTLLSEDEVKGLFMQMVTVLKHLKSKGITHRDLKPDNFLVAEGDILKLADFGIAMGSGKLLSTMCGTPAYLAPEVILGKEYDSRVDIYSIGVILFFLLSGGGTPYQDATTENELFTRVKNGDINWSAPSWSTISGAAKDLVKKLMALDPNSRPKLEDIENHIWFKKVYGVLIRQESSDEIQLYEPVCRIGRLPENTISLLDPRISKKHCSITFSEDGNPILKVDSQNRIKVNTVAVVEQTQLRDGDVIQLAPNTAKQPNLIYLFRSNFALPPSPINKRKRSPSDSPPTAVAETTLLKRSKSENSSIPTPSGGISRTSSSCSSAYFQFDLTPNSETFWMRKNTVQGGNVISIGRSPDSSIVLNHVLVSTRHCRVFKSGGEAVLEDLSSNGTLVNGNQVGKGNQVVLNDGDVICVCPAITGTLIDFTFHIQ